jgi:hypothetical protein
MQWFFIYFHFFFDNESRLAGLMKKWSDGSDQGQTRINRATSRASSPKLAADAILVFERAE